MEEIKIGDRAISMPDRIEGIVVSQYYPTACGQQTMIETDDGRLYNAPSVCFRKINI